MSETALKRILSAVAVVAALYVLAALLRSPGDPAGAEETALQSLLASIDPERVEQVRFVRAGDTVRLERAGEEWRVQGFRADSSRVEQFWQELVDARSDGVIARNPENHARLGVVDEEADRLIVEMGDGETAELLVGEPGGPRPSVYVRLPDRDPVHLLRSNLRSTLRRDVDLWRDRTVLNADTTAVETVEVVRPDGSYTLARSAAGWAVDGEPGDTAEVRSLLGGIASLRATGFADDTTRTTEPERMLTALDATGDTLASLAVFGSDESGYHARPGSDSVVYELSTFQVGRLFPDPAAVRGEAPDGS